MSSGSVSTLLVSDSSITAWSPPGRSVRPMDPAKSRSPENMTWLISPGAAPYGVRKVIEPGVWPGVWSTLNVRPASSRSAPSPISVTASGSANSYFPPSSIPAVSGDIPAIGSESR